MTQSLRDYVSPASLLDRLIALCFRFKAFRLAEGLISWGKGNHRQQYVCFKTKEGVSLWLNPLNYIDRLLLAGEAHDPEVLVALRSVMRPGDVLWDIGANLGLISLSLLHNRPDLEVVAFEPSPFNLIQLHLNNQLNGNRMQIISHALSDRSGLQLFSLKVNRNTGMCTLHPEARFNYDFQMEVYCDTADGIIARGAAKPPTLIKLDVEGAEMWVLRGMAGLLESPTLRALIFEGPTANHIEIIDALKAKGFTRIVRLSDQDFTNFLATREEPI